MNAPTDAFLHDKLQALQAQADEFIAVRRDIHKHPEMGYKEYRTSDLVAEQLAAWGYQVTRGLGGTGVVGQLKKGTGSKSIGIRADMDALPIDEATGLPYASRIDESKSELPSVLFVCSMNSVRSPIAAALARLEAAGGLPDLIVSLGSCGSRVLDHAAVYQASSVAYRDMDASPLGFPKGVTPLLHQPAVLPLPCPIPGVPTATLSTGANVVSGAAYDAIDAEMVDMETWALVRAAQTFGVPLIALRGVSDGRAELKALEDWTSTLHHVDETLAVALDRLIAVLEADGVTSKAAMALLARPEMARVRQVVTLLWRNATAWSSRDQADRFEPMIEEYLFHHAMRAAAWSAAGDGLRLELGHDNVLLLRKSVEAPDESRG